nr:GNAT family N-acetyltransferase [candidate division Zixibacteria bacterium]
MEHLIRHLDATDYDILIRLWSDSGLTHHPHGRDSKTAMEREFKRMETCILGMFDGSRLIGSIIGTTDGRKGWLNRLAIDPDYRGRGLAGQLIAEVENYLHEQGIKVIACLIEEYNTPSMAAFTKAGYIHDPAIHYFSKRSTADD